MAERAVGRAIRAREREAYDTARNTVIAFWDKRLAEGATFDVPEAAVQDAQRGILTQLIAYGWRYSVGNPYEELSYAESLDAAEIAAEYGYSSVAKQILDFALSRMKLRPQRFTAFRGAHILTTAATYYRLTRDRSFLHAQTPALAELVTRIAQRQVQSGPAKGRLLPEALSTDLEGPCGRQRLRADRGGGGAARDRARVELERLPVAGEARADARGEHRPRAAPRGESRVGPPARPLAVRARPADRKKAKAYGQVTDTRDGSYWNLVMPYAFGSGWFAPHSSTSRGILRYLFNHGARLLGVPRTYARTVYGTAPGAGLAQVYGLGTSRFLADNDQPDQLVLSLYGMLAAGMTAGTYISGEAVSVLPVRGAFDRAMFMPPNSGANASYLGTLRELLVHERRGPLGAPVGLDLAFSTPRAWLADGQQIDVRSAPTSFGKVSYTLTRSGSTISGKLTIPYGPTTRLRLRLPAGEHLARVLVGATTVAADRAGTIDLGARHGSVVVRATVAR